MRTIEAVRDGKGDAAPKQLQGLLEDDGSKIGARAQRILTALQTTGTGA